MLSLMGGPNPKSCLIFLCGPDFQLEPQSTELAQEERFKEVLKEYELKCRVRAPPSPFTILSLSISFVLDQAITFVFGAWGPHALLPRTLQATLQQGQFFLRAWSSRDCLCQKTVVPSPSHTS